MAKNLVIVESPAKAKTIGKFLGKDFEVMSSFGHIRDLDKKNFGIDIEHNYQPKYIISEDKKKVVSQLRKSVKDKDTIWIASDEDREGEAIAWHLFEVLRLKNKDTKRIVFHEITKTAIEGAVNNPREIDYNLVNAQQARRILDRLVGFELSPILWKKVRPSLSAGRVQSVSVRLLVEREREIINFKPKGSFRVRAKFGSLQDESKILDSELNIRLKNADETKAFLEYCKTADFKINDITKKPAKRSPAAPFTTSTLQQEASRKFGFSVLQTMRVAQKLYEAGHITYMRTDSVNLSDLALNTAKSVIESEIGSKYYKRRKYSTKSKGAQEAHEAIRPTYLDKKTISGTAQEKKLYDLIRKRTLASQMADAQFERTQINIGISNHKNYFVAKGEVLIFDGFLKLYMESTDDDSIADDKNVLIPNMSVGEELMHLGIDARERFSNQPARYTEASLVKKLEELGIGRPSTYAPTITTIQNRGYVIKESREGQKREYRILNLTKSGKLTESSKEEYFGADKNKLFPTDIGMVVTDFLVENFSEILNYNFTATVEEQFDQIALGKKDWPQMIDAFYKPFHELVEKALTVTAQKIGNRLVGNHPENGLPIYAKIGRFGPYVQLGENPQDGEEKPKYAGLKRGQHIDTITIEEALELFKLPRDVGMYENKKIVAAIGRFGPYIRHNSKFVSLKKYDEDPLTVSEEKAIEIIELAREEERKKTIKIFDEDPEVKILNGRWGPYISYQKKNYKIPKDKKPEELSLEDCKKLIEEAPKKTTAKKTTKKATATKKTGTAKKATTKSKTTKKTTTKTKKTGGKTKK